MDPVTRLGTRGLGALLVATAAWGGIVAFVGPTFGFDLSTSSAWVWNQNHAALYVVPSVVGIAGGLLMLVGVSRALERIGALLALTSGVWFLIGPTLEPLWRSDALSTTGTVGSSDSTLERVLEGIGYHYGTGTLIVMLSAFALGLLALARTARATTPATATTPTQPQLSFHHTSLA